MIKRRLKDLKNGEAIAIKIKKGKYKNKYLKKLTLHYLKKI